VPTSEELDDFVDRLKESVRLVKDTLGMRILDEGPGNSSRKVRLSTALEILDEEFEKLLSS
jgi:hypothetical protein